MALDQGTIIKTRLKEERDEDSYHYCVYITYQYAVNGKKYTGKKYSASDTVVCKSKKIVAQSIMEHFKVGKKISVFYNSNKPQVAYIHMSENVSGMVIVLFALGSMVILTMIVVIVVVMRDN